MFLIKREVDAYEENDLIEIIDSSIADSCLDAYRSYEIVEKI